MLLKSKQFVKSYMSLYAHGKVYSIEHYVGKFVSDL